MWQQQQQPLPRERGEGGGLPPLQLPPPSSRRVPPTPGAPPRLHLPHHTQNLPPPAPPLPPLSPPPHQVVDEPQLNAGGFLADKDHRWYTRHRLLCTGTPVNGSVDTASASLEFLRLGGYESGLKFFPPAMTHVLKAGAREGGGGWGEGAGGRGGGRAGGRGGTRARCVHSQSPSLPPF